MKTNNNTIGCISKSKRKIDMCSVLAAAMAFAIALSTIGKTPPTARAQVAPELADFGDAPDSGSNHAGVATNTAYPGVPGNFPTVWDGTNGFAAAGPRHLDPTKAYLGNNVSEESDADLAPDQDGVLNILNGGSDNSDNDRGDDGWRNTNLRFHDCASVPLIVRIRRDAIVPLNLMYLNVWFDGNRDGDWNDHANCIDLLDPIEPPTGLPLAPQRTITPIKRYEWIVQNQPIFINAVPQGGFWDFVVYTKRVLNTTPGQNHWLRFTLSDQTAITPTLVVSGSVALPDGRGLNPPNYFLYGETEDYKQDANTGPQPGTLVINKTAIAPANPSGGAAVNYRIDLEHVGGATDAVTTIKDRLPNDVSFVGPLSVSAISGTVSPLSATVANGLVEWNGQLSPGAKLRIVVPVRIDPCVGANKIITNTARALQTDGTVISDSSVLNVACSSPPNVDVKKELIRVSDDTHTSAPSTDQHVLPGDDLIFRITARNNGAEPVVVFVHDEMPDGIRATESGDPTSAKGRIAVNPGLTGMLDIPAQITSRCDVGRVITNVATYTAVPGSPIEVSSFNLPPTLPRGQTNVVTMRVSCHDLGDAPDSTNHFGANMTAYPAVQANFPTVFDVATGAIQGPLHRNPHPFHLGAQFSSEAEADVGPDQDGIRNIVPTANDPDNDRHEDGVHMGKVVFTDCATTMIPVQIFVGPNAAAFFAAHVGNGNGYLNVWVDGNRDGDWADVRQCPGNDGNRPAFEHIVIDHPISIAALGAGLHTLNVPTRLVPWPVADANKPSWLRFTLSAEPSAKPLVLNGFNYGDGRGIAPPFVTGETEDYLWRPPYADVAIRKRGAMRTDSGEPVTTTTDTDNVVWLLEYANLGSANATNVVITDDWTQGGNGAGLEITTTPPVSYTTSGKITTFNIGNLAAGASGRIVIELARNYANFVYTNTATITATSDSDAGNNSAIAEVKHKFIQPPIILNPLDGTTCDGDFTGANAMLGITTEGATVDVYVDGTLTATLTAGGAGYFRPEISLPDGEHTIYAVAKLNGHEAVGEERRIIVNSALTFDPLSIRFKLEGGGAYRPTDDDGRTDESGWSVHLLPSRNYTASVRLCCESPNAQVTFDVGGTTLILTDPDGDHVYEAPFVSPPSSTTVTSTLSVSCNGSEIETQSEVLIDPDGVVYDINTGAPLSAAQAVCMVQSNGNVGATNGSAVSDNYSVWPAANFGQLNPQTTKSDGYFSFFTPAGTYRLDVNKSGYQPYRSPNLQVVSTPVRHDVPLTPNIIEKPKVTITINENGFEPAMVKVAPGTAIAFVNADTRDHSAQGKLKSSAQAIETGGFNSGMLGPNQSHVVKLSKVGTYLFNDSANPEASGTIVVEGAIGYRVLLPLVRK